MKFYDLSLPVSEKLPLWPGDPPISMHLAQSLSRGDAANLTRFGMSAHAGTHIDAPFHFDSEGVGVDQLPLEALIGPCRLIDLRALSTAIERSDLNKYDWGGIRRVLFKTRNSEAWAKMDGTFDPDYVFLSLEAAHFLLEKDLQVVGIDALSIESFKSSGYPTHRLLLKNHVIILEGLNLSAVPEGDYELIALPLKLAGADGAPARVVLRENKS